MLDDIAEFAKQYRLVVWGAGGLVGLLVMVMVYFQHVRGKWNNRKK